ncbi:MAG TPA: hypothetical protein VMF56_01130 [Acidobacteriaceae bacterium]|nr:hypothetical protein [Acidobacteriaceae bacterium]
MPSEQDAVLIAVWVEKEGEAPWFAGVPEQPSVYHLRCVSSSQEVNFRFQTGNLIAEAKRKCALLMGHGFTVVRVSKHIASFANSDGNSQHNLIQAAMNHLVAVYEQGKETMADYDETFAREVLAFVASRHPNRVQMMEIKEATKPEPTDGELLVALDALAIDGYIEGHALRESSSGKSKLAAMANILSTKLGREFLRPANKINEAGSISNLHFHGPVGAVGHQSTGNVTVNQQWVTAAPDPDWHVVAQAFKEAVADKAKVASSSEDFLVVSALAKAQEEATQKNKAGFLDAVSKLGQSAVPILARAGAHGLVSYLEQHFNWKLT